MVLERIINVDLIEHRPYIAFILGLVYTVIGYFTATIFFGKHTSIAMLFLTTLLLVPSLAAIISVEEKKESKEGIKHFFHNHKEVFEVFLFAFIGIFVGYLLMGCYFGSFDTVFNYQVTYLEDQGSITGDLIETGTYTQLIPQGQQFGGILTANLMTTIIFFILSLFYGVGGIFLIILNASIFAGFIIYVMRFAKTHIGSLLGAFSIHMIPEVSGFLLAAIAGGVVSKAVMTEKFGSKGFRNVMQDAVALLGIAFVIIIFAALLEVYVSGPMFIGILS